MTQTHAASYIILLPTKGINMKRVIFAVIRPLMVAIVRQNNEIYCVHYLHVVVYNIIKCKFAIHQCSSVAYASFALSLQYLSE